MVNGEHGVAGASAQRIVAMVHRSGQDYVTAHNHYLEELIAQEQT